MTDNNVSSAPSDSSEEDNETTSAVAALSHVFELLSSEDTSPDTSQVSSEVSSMSSASDESQRLAAGVLIALQGLGEEMLVLMRNCPVCQEIIHGMADKDIRSKFLAVLGKNQEKKD
jgi:hypothetical protein